MKLLEDRILNEAIVRDGNILDVSSFINNQIDAPFMQALGYNFAEVFKDSGIDVVVTVESSGIAPSIFAALALNVPLVVLKKQTKVMDDEEYVQKVCDSYTKGQRYFLTSKRSFIEGKNILLIDDFLAKGSVVKACESLFDEVGANLLGFGVCISKNYQEGFAYLKTRPYKIYSQAQVESMDDGIKFTQ